MQIIDEIKKLFDYIIEPKLKWNINTLGLLKKVDIKDDTLYVHVALITKDENQIINFKEETLKHLKTLYPKNVELKITQANLANSGIDGVKKIILVASGKGGVGKSTISVNLTASLKKLGFNVGLLDADIYGPSIPIMLGCENKKPSVSQDEHLDPIDAYGIKFISVGSLVKKDKALNWRGQMISGTILQFIKNTAWGELDFLVIDMPPGTGDIHITLANSIKPDGVVIVTTPQEVVIGDVIRSVDQFREQHFPIIGLVENMSYMLCENCNHENHPFHKSTNIIEGIDIISKLPLNIDISSSCDKGIPLVLENKNEHISKIYEDLALKVCDFVEIKKG